MTISNFATHAVFIAAALAMLAGCGGGSPPSALGAPGAPQASRMGFVPQVRPERHRSWMSPDARKRSLLYASDEDTGNVDVYDYTSGKPPQKLYGQITGFQIPDGLCVDGAGD